MDDTMTFPKTVEEFMEEYKIVDSDQVYTNGAELVPIFRMKQWFEHINATSDAVAVCRCKDCVYGIEEDGGIKCVASADYDEMSNDWFGFVSWHEQDWFCADGERKGGDE